MPLNFDDCDLNRWKCSAPPFLLLIHHLFLWEQSTFSVTDTQFLQTEAWDTWKLAICPWWFTLSHSFSVTPFSIYVPTGKMLSEELTIEEAFTKRNAYSVAKLYAPNKKCSCLDTMLNNLNLFLFPAKTLVRGLFWSPCKGNSNANMRIGLGVYHILSLYWSESVGFGFHPASSNLYF